MRSAIAFVRRCALVLWILVLIPACRLQAEPTATPEAPLLEEPLRERLQDRDYKQALKGIDEAARKEAAAGDYLAYLKGWVLYLDHQDAATVEQLHAMPRQYPQSPWLPRARVVTAMALSRQGDHRAASALWRAQAEEFLSPQRQQEWSELYLEFADRAYQPPEPDARPDYALAFELYQKARSAGVKAGRAMEVDFREARCLQALQRHADAAKRYEQFLKEHPKSTLADEARFRHGETLLAAGKSDEARRVWRELIAASDAKSPWAADASFRLPETWKLPKPGDETALELGVSAQEDYLKRFPLHKNAAAAQLRIAASYVHRDQPGEAVARLERLLADARYQDRAELAEARRLLGETLRGMGRLEQCLTAWREYLARHPAHEKSSEVQRLVIDVAFDLAIEHYKAQRYDAARKQFLDFEARYPLDSRNARIAYLLGDILHRQKQYPAAIAAWRLVLSKYPNHEEASRAQHTIARTLEVDLSQPEEALKEYAKVRQGTSFALAQAAAQRLTTPSLSLQAERKCRTGKPPCVTLVTRNLATVQFRLYRIDLETYFRKAHTLDGIEMLDVGLIDPDRTLAFRVPGPKTHVESRLPVEIPLFDKASAGAVVVHAADQRLESACLLIQSDLELIAWASRDEVLIWTQNVATGKPWPGVRLLISNGQQVVVETQSGPDGIAKQPLPKTIGKELRVFASAGAHVAAASLDLDNARAAEKPKDLCFVETDSPAYAPGQTVRVRAAVRRGGEEGYLPDAGTNYCVELFDPRKRRLWQTAAKTNALGVLSAELPIPTLGHDGAYEIHVQNDSYGPVHERQFPVYRPETPFVHLDIDLPRTAYVRGENVEGRLQAWYQYGAPLADAEVQYSLECGPKRVGRTDAQGLLSFSLSTRDGPADDDIQLSAKLTDRDVAATRAIRLAAADTSVLVFTPRRLYVQGESCPITVAATGPRKLPAARKVRLQVFAAEKDARNRGPLIETRTLETSLPEGRARYDLAVKQSGQYFIRVDGGPEAPHVRPATVTIDVPDDRDPERLRLLPDTLAYSLGETAKIKIHWRGPATTGLVACRTTRVLRHEFISLNPGFNTLSVPVTAELAPNFDLSVAAIPEVDPASPRPLNPWHDTTATFSVSNFLAISTTVKRVSGEGPLRPGDEVELAMTACDVAKKPVAADLSVSLLGAALAEEFPSDEPAIEAALLGPDRPSGMCVGASPVSPPVTPKEPELPQLLGPKAPAATGGGFFAVTDDSSVRSGRRDPAKTPDPTKDVGYWNPSLATGADGKASLRFRLPERSNTWKLTVRGVTSSGLAGAGTQTVSAAKDVWAELRAPSAWVAGDQIQLTAVVHNDTPKPRRIEVRLETSVAAKPGVATQTIDVPAKSLREVAFQPAPEKAGGALRTGQTIVFRLTARSEGQEDVVQRRVPVATPGLPVVVTVGGVASGTTSVWLDPSKRAARNRPRLEIRVGASLEQTLLEALRPDQDVDPLDTPLESRLGDLLGALGLLPLTRGDGPATAKIPDALDLQIRRGISQLTATQLSDGGWSWSGKDTAADLAQTARAVWVLSLARNAGYRDANPMLANAIKYLQQPLASLENMDHDSHSIILHALAVAGQGDFPLANQLYRDRATLSTSATVHLASALACMDRKNQAVEVLERVAADDLDDPQPAGIAQRGPACSPAEAWAMAALVWQNVRRDSPQAKTAIQWLLEHRDGQRWRPDRGTGPAILALGTWFAQQRVDARPVKLSIRVNGKPVRTVDLDPKAAVHSVDVPDELLAKGKQEIRFETAGPGHYVYQALWRDELPAAQVQSTVKGWLIRRVYQPAPIVWEGKTLDRGFDILLGPHTAFVNPLTQLPVAERTLVEVHIRRAEGPAKPAEPLDDLVLHEPIPGGTAVDPASVVGQFKSGAVANGQIVIHVSRRATNIDLAYTLYGALPGNSQARPTILQSATRPERMAVGSAKPLAVLPVGGKSADSYALSPRELLQRGQGRMEKRQFAAAIEDLALLVDKYRLQPNVYRDAVRMLLGAHLEVGPASKVVRYSEIVRQKWPDQEFPFSVIPKIGSAYGEMGEHERSSLVYRLALQGYFARESAMAGFLDGRGEFLRSVAWMDRLLREYPPEEYTARAELALAQQIHAKAAEASKDTKLRAAGVDREELTRRAWRRFEILLATRPEEKAADETAFAAASALLDLKDYARASAACDRYARRYAKSPLLDAYWYLSGYCQFALNHHEAALELCRKVAEYRPRDADTGKEKESRNKWRAIYIMGQIHHSLDRPADAIREYRRVEERFPDAARSIRLFTRKWLSLAETNVIRPGQPVELELKYCNVESCDLKVYRIDLMKFGLLQRDLQDVTQVNLAGIKPTFETSVPLGDGKDYRDRTRKLSLPLADEGAYLLVCRGSDLHASSLVLVSPLLVEVEQEPDGSLRALVKNTVSKRGESGANVRVLGSASSDVVVGTTDLRGIFSADDVRGTATVIVQAGTRAYAYYRTPGLTRPRTVALQTGRRRQPREVRDEIRRPETADARLDVDLLPGVAANANPHEAAAARAIYAALESSTAMDFVQTPLADVLAYLSDRHGIEIQMDKKALEDVGLQPDTPVTRRLRNVTLKSALRLMLRDLDLTYMLDGGVLLITTPERADARLATIVYPVKDLLTYRDPSGKEWCSDDFDSLIEIITSTVKPTTWDTVGGPGSISPFEAGGALVFSQTQEVHEEVQDLLANLRRVRKEQNPDGKPPIKEKPEMPPEGGGRPRGAMVGVGGMGGGMGMGGSFGPTTKPGATLQSSASQKQEGGAPRSAKTAKQAPQDDLLRGLHDTQRENQGSQVKKLKKMYQDGAGMGGMSGGGVF